MKRARVMLAGVVHAATERDGQVVLDDGRRLWQDQVAWLPPLMPLERPRTIVALDLDDRDGARELSSGPPGEPLVFLKGERSLIGHREKTRRPAGVQTMHHACELAVVIGRQARRVKRDDAYGCVAGYTVANDYTVRDHLENWYRPNLRAKNRDGATPVGPWLVDAGDVPDPMALGLKTTVNGRITQQGSTRDMIFDVPFLVEYFSSFMTLNPGDVILTGAAGGVVDCQPGDVVVCEIEGLGALMNTIA